MDRDKRTDQIPRYACLQKPFFDFTGFLSSGCFVLLLKSNPADSRYRTSTFSGITGVYTPLKKVFSMAIIPGSLVGALPPLAGWLLPPVWICFDPKILLVCSYFFVW